MRRRFLAGLLPLGLLVGCAEGGAPVAGVYHPTLIEVSPDEFLGDIPCADAPGAMQTYVATLFDVEFDADGVGVGAAGAPSVDDAVGAPVNCNPSASQGLPLPSSGPVSCKNAVAFARVADLHRYRAEIHGYEQQGLVPLGATVGASLGTPILVDPVTGSRVEPRWTISCGDECPAIAQAFLSRDVKGCVLVSDTSSTPSGPTNVSVELSAALGDLTCGSASGSVHHFEVDAGGETLTALCGESVLVADVKSGAELGFAVRAYEVGNPAPRWATTCIAVTQPGVTVSATCAELSDQGAVDVDPGVALAALSTDCAGLGDLAAELELTLNNAAGEPVGRPRYVDAASCGRSTRFTGVSSGPVLVRGALLGGGNDLGLVSCRATVVPGAATSASCAEER